MFGIIWGLTGVLDEVSRELMNVFIKDMLVTGTTQKDLILDYTQIND